MGHPRKRRKKFSKPSHPWQSDRIEKEKILETEYGFKNKKEIWKLQSKLRRFTKQAKNLANLNTLQADKERKQLLDKLFRLNLLNKNSALNDVLNLTLDDLAGRRLQTLVFKRGLARTVNQARQFIVHKHILIGENKVDVPSYLVYQNEENLITFDKTSSLDNLKHPERVIEEKKKKKEEIEEYVSEKEKKEKKEVKEKVSKEEKEVKEEVKDGKTSKK